MGVNVELQDERGSMLERVLDTSNLLPRALPANPDGGFHFASTIDQYGDTTFNPLQARRLAEEWKRLLAEPRDADTDALLRAVLRMVETCAAGTHVYLKFIGD